MDQSPPLERTVHGSASRAIFIVEQNPLTLDGASWTTLYQEQRDMKRAVFAQSCCTTPSAIGLWSAMFVVLYGAALLLGAVWPALRHYGDTLILLSLAGACFVNFARNRTLHCGLTGPLFVVAAIVALLMEAGIWSVNQSILWAVVLVGVGLAFVIEWRVAGRTTAVESGNGAEHHRT